MTASKMRHPVLLALGILIVVAAVVAVIKRDTIADLILRGGDVTLTEEAAKSSPQAKLAMDFLAAFRTMDKEAIARYATAEQVARIQQEAQQPNGDFQKMRAMMLEDLPADSAALRDRIKSVQMHGNLAAVWFETKANSWFLQLAQMDGGWKVSGF